LVERKKVIIVGIPGVGKTSLVTKVVELIKAKNKTASVHSYGTVMLELAKAFGVKDRDELRTLPVESLLNRYIPSVTIIGSVILGLIAGVSDVLGVFGSGIGVLLMVDILINYYNQLIKEQVEVVMPRLGALLGRT